MKLVLALIFIVAFVFLAPYPYYNPENYAWHLGPSLLGRSIGESDSNVPAEKIVSVVTKSAISSPLTIDCVSNLDCSPYIVKNQCRVYCGNADEINIDAVTQLEKDRVCDTGLWRIPEVRCYCVQSKCVDLK